MKILKWLTSRKYRYFYRKVIDVQNSIFEYEFKVAKSRQVREGIRQDRDRAVEGTQQIKVAIEGAKDQDQKTKLETEYASMVDTVKRFEAQMGMIDAQIQGGEANRTEVNPAGIGILEQIKSLTELRLMYQDYLTRIL